MRSHDVRIHVVPIRPTKVGQEVGGGGGSHGESLGLTWSSLDSLGFTWTDLDSFGFTLDSFGFT